MKADKLFMKPDKYFKIFFKHFEKALIFYQTSYIKKAMIHSAKIAFYRTELIYSGCKTVCKT